MEPYRVFDSEQLKQFTQCPQVSTVVPGYGLTSALVANAFRSGRFWTITNSSILQAQTESAQLSRYLRVVKVKVGPLKSRLRLWCTQLISESPGGAVAVTVHGFDEREKNHVVSMFTLSDTEQGLQIVYEERVSTSSSVVNLASKKMKLDHSAVLQGLVARISQPTTDTDGETAEADGKEDDEPTVRWQDIDKEEAVYRLQHAIDVGNRKRKGGGRTFHNVFVGNEAVDAALEELCLPTRADAVAMMSDLMSRGYFYRAGDLGAFEDSRTLYSWTSPIQVAFEREFSSTSEEVTPVPKETQLPAALSDNDSWPLIFLGALVASQLFMALPAPLLLILFVATFYFALRRGQRLERNKLLKLIPKPEAPAKEYFSKAPVSSRCLLSVEGNCVAPNGEPISFENQFCKGKALLKTRTSPVDPRVADYFRGKNRMFELQCQFTLKEALEPDELLYVGGETKAPLSLSVGRRFLCATIINALKLFNKTLHFSFGTKDGSENAHLCFPFRVMPDDLIVTPPGETPPDLTLGYLPSGKAPASDIKMELGYTYTIAFYSQYLDLERWMIQKLPGLSDIDLSTFWQDNPLFIVAYRVRKQGQGQGHSVAQRKLLLDIELVNDSLPRYQELISQSE